MAKRKAISKSTRFRVFKRDEFTCQYCGRKPPIVVLVIDHVCPVADGGDNDATNLVSSCEDCNSGKGREPLSIAPEVRRKEISRQKELAAQTAELNFWLLEKRAADSELVYSIGRYWWNKVYLNTEEKDKWTFNDVAFQSVKRFTERLTFAEIIGAIDITFARIPWSKGGKPSNPKQSGSNPWSYFCGVCWRIIKQRQGNDIV